MATGRSDRHRHPRADERGAGLFGTIAGVTVFLALLTVAVQLLFNLYAVPVVTAAAYDAARQAATDGGDRDAAEARARSLLGRVGDSAAFEWIDTDPDVVQLHVVARAPRFLLPVVDTALGLDVVDRTVTVRVEELQA